MNTARLCFGDGMVVWVRFKRAMFATLLAFVLAGCGGIGDVGSQSDSPAQLGSTSTSLSISGQPKGTVAAGRAYSFQPTVAGGSRITFTATNLPAWLTLNAATGRLTGSPQPGDVATYTGITLTASDGTTTRALGPFAITVVAMGAGTVTLAWVAPTQNTDGSALTDLSGYVLYFGESSDDMSESIAIDNPSLSTYVVDNLTSGTWYFAVQAVNAKGVASSNSIVANKTIS